jgi:aminoglycoside phosphotransferase (APT) family kinase protein
MLSGFHLVAREGVGGGSGITSSTVRKQVSTDIESMGIEVEQFMKQRGDTKAVVLCRHPRWGRCVYKGYPAFAKRRLAHAHTAAARLTAERQSPLVPEVFEVGDHYSLEAYVQGASLSELREDEWRRLDLVGFVDQVRALGQDGNKGSIREDQQARIVEYYVRKALHDVANGPLGTQLVVMRRMVQRHRELRALVHAWLRSGTGELTVGWALNDLNVRNVVREDESGALYVIDTEDIGTGHFMFDLVWFIAHAARLEIPSDRLEEAYRHMFRVEVCGSAADVQFFRRMLAFLLTMHAVRASSAPARRLLSMVSADLEPGISVRASSAVGGA